MSFTYSIQTEADLVVVVFRGDIEPAEETEAFLTVTSDPALAPNSRFLVDKRTARMKVGPEHVEPQIALIEARAPRMGTPKMAVVVGSAHDFGMMRVLEAQTDGRVSLDFCVFREMDEALEWLGVSGDDLVWPDPPD